MKVKKVVMERPGVREVRLPFVKEGQEMELEGVILGREKGDYVLRVVADHQVGRTNGRVTIKGVAQNGANVRVEGMIKIDEGAQGVDDFLEIRLLILDGKSSAVAEPKLEIEANEVKASHAASVGRIDQEQVFYLMSRGLSGREAEDTIVEGFLKL